MEKQIMLEDLEKRVAALEKTVSTLIQHTNLPSGTFASIGGIERRPASESKTPEKPIDFSEIGGKRVG